MASTIAALAGCAPTYLSELPNGDQQVTTYARGWGLPATAVNNREAVIEACEGDQPIIFDEQVGLDSNGRYRRWTFGCVAPAAVPHSPSGEAAR